jgi:threonine dehydrogenase-like Zn-dependent dehydrogenase
VKWTRGEQSSDETVEDRGSMRTLVLEDWRRLVVEEAPDPQPAAGEVLVRTIATGICGSDVHGYTGENGRRALGQVMGHETVGRVEALGPGADPGSGLSVGDVVTLNPVIGCGRCEQCRDGSPQACSTKTVVGVTPSYTSAFSELVVAPAPNVIPLPEGTPVEYGALVEPLAVGYHAARRGSIEQGALVLVVGGGPIGQACVLAAQRLGADRVVVSEPSQHRRSLCSGLGAAVVDPTSADDLATAVIGELGGRPSVVLDAVGTVASLEAAFACAPLMSTIVLVGMGQQVLQVAAFEVSTKERAVVGSFCYTPVEFAETASWVGSCPHDLGLLIQDRVPLARADEAFADLADGRGDLSKILVMVQE